jgi:hypothetical protein
MKEISGVINTMTSTEAEGLRELIQRPAHELSCMGVVGRCDLRCDGRSVTPALGDCVLPPPWLGLLSCKQLAIPAATAGILLTKSRQQTVVPLLDPCLLPDEYACLRLKIRFILLPGS